MAYAIFLILFIATLSYFAYFDTRKGVRYALPLFLQVFIPMLLSGIIVKLSQLITKYDLVSYIVGGIGTVIFFIVLLSVFKPEKSSRQLGVLEHFFGFILGILRGWLFFGFVMFYLDVFHLIHFHAFLSSSLISAIEKPVKWIMLLDFIKF